MLLEKVWDYNFDPQTNVIDVHVSRLRRKIDKDFDRPLLQTVRGAGALMVALMCGWSCVGFQQTPVEHADPQNFVTVESFKIHVKEAGQGPPVLIAHGDLDAPLQHNPAFFGVMS